MKLSRHRIFIFDLGGRSHTNLYIDLIKKALQRSPWQFRIAMAVFSITAAYSMFFIGFFSRTPIFHITIMGAWSTSGIAIEVVTKVVMYIFAGKVIYYFIYGVIRGQSDIRIFPWITSKRLKKYRVSRLLLARYLRRNSSLGSLSLGVVLFFILGVDVQYGRLAIIYTLLGSAIAPVIVYPLFFRPVHLTYSRPVLGIPKRPKGVSDDRWFAYLFSCFSIIFSYFFFISGQSFFNARAAAFQTLYTRTGAVVGSTIAANASGVLFLERNIEAENWQYSKRDYVFYSFDAIEKISDKSPNS